MRTLTVQLLAILAVASPAVARAQVTVFEGAPGLAGSVRAYDESSGALVAAPAELAAVELLPIEAAGRTALEEFLPGKARRIEDVAGASRLALPDLQGSLYHFVRGPAGSRTFGYFLVTRAGIPEVLLERPGVGVGTAQDPFLERVAVAPDGRAFLCATRVNAGGDLLEVRFATAPAQIIDRTAGAPPLRFGPRGIALTATHAWALCGRGLLRGSRSGTGIVQLVGFAPEAPPSHYQGDLVASQRGTAVAFHAGSSPTALHVWTATTAGNVRRASTTPGANSDAGFLPQAIDGPYLAVSDDGTWCTWRSAVATPLPGVTSNECVVARAAAPLGEVPEVLTSDARFTDTLDEVAVFFFRGPSQVVFAVGERGVPAGAGIEGVDLFRATLTPGAPPPIENLTGSSGDFTAPFTGIPQLKPSRWLLSPDRRSLLLHDDQGSGGRLLAIDTATGSVVTVLDEVKSFDWAELCGQRLAFGVQRSSGAKWNEVHSMLATLTGPAVRSFWSDENEPTRATAARADGLVSWLRATGGGEVLQRVLVPGTAVETWGPAATFQPGQGFTAGNAQAFGSAGAVQLWQVGGGTSAWPIAGAFQVLPGA